MLGYCSLGTNDLETSAAFYEPIAQILGHSRVMETERAVMWSTPGRGAAFCVIKPYDGQPATVGNGTMFGFAVDTDAQVDEIYQYALANGGSDEGPPGERSPQFYGAYFRDPAGNKLVAYHFREDAA
jgi:catechol 2,3-dioxygenase-like lactoylglutathione lyase family enzyme